MPRSSRIILQFIVAGLSLIVANSSWSSDFINAQPLLQDVNAGNGGKELIVPLISATDNTGDGYPDRFRLNFRVFDPASRTRLYSTRFRYESIPQSPCSAQPDYLDWDWSVEFIDSDTGNDEDVGLFMTFYVECADFGGDLEERFKTYLYVADTSMSGASTWIEGWNQEGVSAHFTDWDGDQMKEVMVILVIEDDTSEEITVKMLNADNGNQESSQRYAISNF